MLSLKVTIWAFVGLMGLATAYLAWMNRASEKVATNLPTALAVGVAGALVTLVFGLQPESRKQTFALEYVLEPATGLPFSCAFVPESRRYTDAGGATVFQAWHVAAPILPEIRETFQKGDDSQLEQLYRRVFLKQVLETLRFTFIKSWDADPSRFSLPTGGETTTYAPRQVRLGRSLANGEVVAIFNGDSLLASDFVPKLNLPPNTNLRATIDKRTTTIVASNPFVSLTIHIADRGVARGLGLLREVCRLPNEGSDTFRRPRYEVTITADFNGLRSGHPAMPLYRHWVDVITGELAQFDSSTRWAAFRDEFILSYSRRTQTPLDELMAETIQKAKQAARTQTP
ncbi:MAG TPA: hypothetical protein VEZ11_07595 [Thermoanaerobaculia bacterium]|nr:hypothetical protein [Thermoanaerobaculia bacterium]